MSQSDFDLVVFGATGFVGRLVCEYLAERSPEDGRELRWAMAGRSMERLAEVRDRLPGRRAAIPLVVADANDEGALHNLCSQTRVVVSTVGPYALYGEPLVRACAETGTDYCDLTGEVHWIRRMIDRYEARAKETGARLVPCCGFDSIPSDLGVLHAQAKAREQWGGPADAIHMRVKAMRGGISGGTVASILNLVAEARRDRNVRRAMADPYLLCPAGHGFTTRQFEPRWAFFDPDARRWAAPFLMAAVNTRVVHRSNALAGGDRIDSLRYDEAVLTGRGGRGWLSAWLVNLGLGLFSVGAWFGPTRWLMQRFLLPKPGQGPGREQRENGFFDLRFFARHPHGDILETRVRGNRDPGYGATSRMLSEAAVCLAREVPEDAPGGFRTPSTLLGNALISRLTERAGLTFEKLDG